MKKVATIIIAIALLFSFSFAFADYDISGLSYDELIKLINEAQMLIMKSDKWQEVEVPPGTYQIGKDIPAGYWTITAVAKQRPKLEWGTALKEDGMSIDFWASSFDNDVTLTGKEHVFYSEGDQTYVSWNLKDGQYLEIKEGSVIFTPFVGNSFSFK